jgi:hypothetical protein
MKKKSFPPKLKGKKSKPPWVHAWAFPLAAWNFSSQKSLSRFLAWANTPLQRTPYLFKGFGWTVQTFFHLSGTLKVWCQRHAPRTGGIFLLHFRGNGGRTVQTFFHLWYLIVKTQTENCYKLLYVVCMCVCEGGTLLSVTLLLQQRRHLSIMQNKAPSCLALGPHSLDSPPSQLLAYTFWSHSISMVFVPR